MSERKRKIFLTKLKDIDDSYLLLGVHGGIFSEGVDFIGNMAIGVFIIGPGLPGYSFEQELKKKYFQTKWNKGFEYAYRNPGMNKVIQAAGRIFRSDEDKGFVMLIGNRFDTNYYSQVFPKDWEIVVADDPVDKIEHFWDLNTNINLLKVSLLDNFMNS